jgi:predicted XRE-type DNA-binding protein
MGTVVDKQADLFAILRKHARTLEKADDAFNWAGFVDDLILELNEIKIDICPDQDIYLRTQGRQCEEIGKRIIQARTNLNMVQTRLAILTGIPQPSLCSLEYGGIKKIKLTRLAAIAAATKTTTDYLIYGIGSLPRTM